MNDLGILNLLKAMKDQCQEDIDQTENLKNRRELYDELDKLTYKIELMEEMA